jgi:hypothetical protein
MNMDTAIFINFGEFTMKSCKNMPINFTNFCQSGLIIDIYNLKTAECILVKCVVISLTKISFCIQIVVHVRRLPCYHSMTRPHVADGGMASSYDT